MVGTTPSPTPYLYKGKDLSHGHVLQPLAALPVPGKQYRATDAA